MSTKARCRSPQAGFLLLEVLVSILIFAIGVLSIVGLQVNSVRQSSAAKYRTDASLLANDVIGRMWVTDRSVTALSTNFSTGGPQYNAWLANVEDALPGAAATPPQITFDAAQPGLVTVSIFWKAPSEPAGDPAHKLTVVTRIK